MLSIFSHNFVVLASIEFTGAAIGAISIPTQSIQAATLVISIIPILALYPFVQRYFIKGIMIGAIKG
ncbi:MAG: hypothetical protein N2380_08295 [bacterium]|nr:hypothetical protein [bacterium]